MLCSTERVSLAQCRPPVAMGFCDLASEAGPFSWSSYSLPFHLQDTTCSSKCYYRFETGKRMRRASAIED